MDLLVLLLAFILFYAFFRSQGGDGLDIKFQPPRMSSAEGKRFWIKASIVIALVIAALLFRWLSVPVNERIGLVLVPILGGTLVYLVVGLRRKK